MTKWERVAPKTKDGKKQWYKLGMSQGDVSGGYLGDISRDLLPATYAACVSSIPFS